MKSVHTLEIAGKWEPPVVARKIGTLLTHLTSKLKHENLAVSIGEQIGGFDAERGEDSSGAGELKKNDDHTE